jgi:PAS domain S-box-containing protein
LIGPVFHSDVSAQGIFYKFDLDRMLPKSYPVIMENASHPSPVSPLSAQVAGLSQLVEQTHNLLLRLEHTLPSNTLDNLSQVARQLTRLGRQVARFESINETLRALVNIAQVVNSSLDLNEVLRIVMDTIIRLTESERGFLMLRDESGELRIRLARNWEQETVDPSEFAISRTIVNRVINAGQPVLTTNAQEDPRFGGHDSIVAYNLRSILCVPLKVKDELTGVIYADNRIRSGLFTETQLELLAVFADQAAVAIENARLFESVRTTLAEVSELKSLMDNVFASIASGVITIDIADQITMCNQAAEAILGCCEESLVGQSIVTALAPLAPRLSKYIAAVWETDQTIMGVEANSILPERGPVSLSLNLSPLKDGNHTTQGVAIVVDDLTEIKQFEAQRRLFERMVSPAVIEQLDPDKLQLGGRRAQITTLFADIRGFTPFSEELPPDQLVAVLNRYLSLAAEAILAQEGTIDKFLGDAIMAWFNAPILQPDHMLRAVRAALAMQASVPELWQELPEEFHLCFGIGIHYGEAVLGLVGSEKRWEYTAVGNSINTAKRIQENAARGQVLVSAEVYNQIAGNLIAHPVEPVFGKGKRQPIQVYEVQGLR